MRQMRPTLLVIVILALGLSIGAQKKPGLIPSDAKFSPDQQNEVTKDRMSADDRKLFGGRPFEPMQFATGTRNGVAYRFYFSDGSGSFESVQGKGLGPDTALETWRVSCEKDAISDEKRCHLSMGLGLFVFMRVNDELSVSVGASHDPGSTIAIRVDDRPADVISERAGFSGTKAKEIVEAIKKGQSVVTRYSEFGKGRKDATFGTYGFAEAMEYMKWALAQIK